MSGSETGVMNSRDPFGVGLAKSPVQPQQGLQGMRLAFGADGTAVYQPIGATSPSYQSSGGGGAGGDGGAGGSGGAGVSTGVNMNLSGEAGKRKRGRPRKYGGDGGVAMGFQPSIPSAKVKKSGGDISPPPAGGSASPNSLKKVRGRPPGSRKKLPMEGLGSAGAGFRPHVITVQAGENVASKLMSLSQHDPRTLCILSANGSISNVTLHQQATSGGTVTYEGKYEILSLSGSFHLTESGGQRSRNGGLSVSLSGSDGRILGGGVAGLLQAASPVQLIVGSFVADAGKESKTGNHTEFPSAPQKVASGGGPTGASSPPSHGTPSESSGGPGSPPNHSTGACINSNPLGMLSMPWK